MRSTLYRSSSGGRCAGSNRTCYAMRRSMYQGRCRYTLLLILRLHAASPPAILGETLRPTGPTSQGGLLLGCRVAVAALAQTPVPARASQQAGIPLACRGVGSHGLVCGCLYRVGKRLEQAAGGVQLESAVRLVRAPGARGASASR
jgi:hypothetical protein